MLSTLFLFNLLLARRGVRRGNIQSIIFRRPKNQTSDNDIDIVPRPQNLNSDMGIESPQGTISRLKYLQSKCGELCNSRRVITAKENGFGQTRAQVDCKWLMSEDLIDASDLGAPYDIPLEFMDDYTMDGRVTFVRYRKHLKQIYLGKDAKTPMWDKEMVEALKTKALTGDFGFGNYRVQDTESVFRGLQATGIKNMSVLVVGSETPWVESLCLAAGASQVTTLEYGAIKTDHPQLVTYTPKVFHSTYIEGKLELFDAVVSFSSVEHSGLGRYGDALNPWGDLMTIARIWCVTKDDGLLFLGVPVGRDCIQFNAHRIYGRVRYPFLVTNWEKVDSFTSNDLDFDAKHCSWTNQKLLTFRKVSKR